MSKEQIHFLTGILAESALRGVLDRLSRDMGLNYTLQVLPITVAALMTVDWIERKISIPDGTDRIILPGYCRGDLSRLQHQLGVPIERGPRDFRQLPRFFGIEPASPDLGEYNIEIIAEINHVPEISIARVTDIADRYARAGADVVDLGCIPGETCCRIGEYTQALIDRGLRVSVDTFNIEEIELATSAGAELVLSVNRTNVHAAADWGCEVVAVPDDLARIESLEDTIEQLESKNVAYRIDPVIEPIGLGLAASLGRYLQARSRWPEAEMMMGIGNLTELTDVDSAGVNFLLLGICEELRIHSVLTTEVINWSRSSVAECDIARRMVYYANRHRVPPKNLSQQLISLRDARLFEFSKEQIAELASQIRDNNYRILKSGDSIHLLGAGLNLSHSDPFELFDRLAATNPKNLTPSHAFYLGYEMCKALTAITLDKNYEQDEALDWGHLTVEERNRHRLTRRFGRQCE